MQFSNCPIIKKILQTVSTVANSNASILITGESGTGKEVLAKAIHSKSNRSKTGLTSINCAAIPESLLESELFGHKKGSFTGASYDHIGLFESADGGTVFLDEIGDMPLSLQAKMLRVLQEKKIRPVGTNSEKTVDFRLISATHRDLKDEIAKGRFREDLFYRLSVIPIYLPPLRERKEDIPNLVKKFLKHFSEKYGVKEPKIATNVMANLIERRWPGNVRELENLVESIIVLNPGKDVIEVQDLPDSTSSTNAEESFNYKFNKLEKFPTVSELTDSYINFVLEQVNFHQGEASRILGMSRRTIYRKLKSNCPESYIKKNVFSLPGNHYVG